MLRRYKANNAKKKFIIVFLFFAMQTKIFYAQQQMPLYAFAIPNAVGNLNNKSNVDSSIYHRIAVPSLYIFPAATDRKNKTAVIICAGGGYAGLNIKREGFDIAAVFNNIGVTAFVLKYRLPNVATNLNPAIAPLQDAQQAIKIVRDSAVKWNIDPNKIGIMGFSAGGHVASAAGVHYKDVFIDNKSNTSLRPDFMLLVYPVISFCNAYGHIGSRNNLLGKNPAADTVKYFSSELHVTPATPPTILLAPGDDNIVSVINSLEFYKALQKNEVYAALHIYSKGGHGFGNTPAFDEWFGRCVQWMKATQLIH